MGKAAIGLTVLGVGFLILVVIEFFPSTASAQRNAPAVPPARGTQDGNVIAFSSLAEGGPQQIVLIDSQTRVISVYHIDRNSGEIALRSVRNARWDSQIEQFNCANPLPGEIRAILENK